MLQFSRHSGIYTLEVEQELPIDIEKAWDFFSNPANLEKITPEYMRFQITSKMPDKVYPGLIITYRVSPLPGVRMNWVTEITHVEENKFFVDEQRFGPYAMWHHEHHFRATDAGVTMLDKLSYKLPLGWLGHLAHRLFVRRQLKNIFDFRKSNLNKLFID